MKIAQIAPIAISVPPKKYGGTERVIHSLTEELVKRGHDVTLFASSDSNTTAKLISVTRSLLETRGKDQFGQNPLGALNYGLAYQMHGEFDIIHDHNYVVSLPTANICPTPVVMTLHGPITPENKRLYETLNNPYIVTVSKSQAIPAPNLNHVGTVYHGFNMEEYPFSKEHDGYLLYVGRISIEKGVHYAIEVAQYLKLPLLIAARVNDEDMPYFKEFVEPHLSDQIRWVGEVVLEERNRLMSKAMAFLHPTNFREPFGIAPVEAMACGCPVIAFNRGSIPEIIIDGKTGFVVEDAAEMIESVRNISKIKRLDCRKYALENFNQSRMADDYEKIYQKIIDLRKSTDSKNDGKSDIIKEIPLPKTTPIIAYPHKLEN